MIDFTLNLYDYVITFVMQDPAQAGTSISNINFWAYMRIFSVPLWLTFLAACVVITATIYVFRWFGPQRDEVSTLHCIVDW